MSQKPSRSDEPSPAARKERRVKDHLAIDTDSEDEGQTKHPSVPDNSHVPDDQARKEFRRTWRSKDQRRKQSRPIETIWTIRIPSPVWPPPLRLARGEHWRSGYDFE